MDTDISRADVEAAQKACIVEINKDPGGRADLEAKHGQVWNAEELRRDFEVLAFAAPVVVVKRRADNVTGSLFFQHSPRFYFQFRVDAGA